ncbi:D-Ala-D-Ala carboxypeptidase family metallohydrolase [Sphingosinicella sp. LY1275]|uniref:D-Ala-D-Ala carboxypeptidase family metallohydrolase n=1 Tax=Sphingosinicella sp. LY1275 TaxID=3095379 RepID=UPI002ADECE8F|nr:D-Ala-D-Ala carboxypeptidase family metallohydrolase [Sphingosinicella sp. LY1275]MEA1013901.1 D-Ala-D-Ala carboxypeptidase family metallohydrolase [Sphingosinicella sp. LY1275]
MLRPFLLFLAGLTALAAPARAQEVAEGQAEADYHAWLAKSPAARAQVIAFKQFLGMEKVEDVLPTWQLVRTASMWRECDGPRFEVAPFGEWQHVAKTLRFVKHHVQPVLGEVEALSGYRNAELNRCARGAPESAHRHFYALDLAPLRAVSRDGMIGSLCAIHGFRGAGYDIGLGFYGGRRFHVDSKGFRKWGPDGKGATSPCNA